MNTSANSLKVIGFSVPVAYAERVNAITRRERRTKRAVFEAMVDLYEETLRKREAAFDALVTKAITEAEEEKRTNPKTPEELLADFEALHNEWSEHNRKLGISYTEDEIVEMIREDRKRGRRRKRALEHRSPPVPPEMPGMPEQP